MNHNDAFLLRRELRLRVLKSLLYLNYKGNSPIQINENDLMESSGLNSHQVRRSLGDLCKGLGTLHIQLDPTSFCPLWRITQPTLKQVAAALEIAMTDGNCTSWNPEG